MKKREILNYMAAFLGTISLTCCTQENTPGIHSTEGFPVIIRAQISGKSHVTSRAIRTEIDDQWSFTNFQEGDMMGFYSSGGNFSSGFDGSEPFINQKLEYDSTQFKDPENGAIFSPTYMNGSEVFMYFPYDENISENGMALRTNAEGNDTLRCVDFLRSNSLNILGSNQGKDMALYGTFQHGFSELIIMRGEGFDSPPEGRWAITVVMSEPITHIKIIASSEEASWSCTPSFIYDENSDLSKDQARRWGAWRGYNYGITENNDPVGTPAWYVIVPSLDNNYSTVDYIELYDNEGYLQRVSSLQLYANTKKVQPGWRYPLEITMKELVPTVNPFPIQPWEDEINLTDERTRGINNITEFASWVRDYNAYIVSQSDVEKQKALLDYGDKYLDANGKLSWHFYVLADLDFTNYTPLPYENEQGDTLEPSGEVIIPLLQDVIDGKSSILSNSKFINFKIKGLTKTFIGEMKPNDSNENPGSVQNFDFMNPLIDNENNTSAAGIIANTMTGASIINCNIINGNLVNPKGPAGMLAGSMNGGTVRDCQLEGFLIGSSTSSSAPKIVGTDPTGNYTIENVDASDVVFE